MHTIKVTTPEAECELNLVRGLNECESWHGIELAMVAHVYSGCARYPEERWSVAAVGAERKERKA